MMQEEPFTQREHDDALRIGCGCAGIAAGLILIVLSIWVSVLFS